MSITIELLLGDCLERMKDIPDGSVDMVLADPPYGVSACAWDSVIPFEPMWDHLKRVIKSNGAVVMTASQPFTTMLIASNMGMFKYCWYWRKSKPNGWQHSKNRPMAAIEECCVFSRAPMGHVSQLGAKRMVYNPQGVVSAGTKKVRLASHGRFMGPRPKQEGKQYEAQTGFPNNVLEYPNVIGKQALHPTQKPVELMEYLIKTYTSEGDTVLDFVMGSGTTGVACKKLNRSFIGIEKEEKYFHIAKERIENTPYQCDLFEQE